MTAAVRGVIAMGEGQVDSGRGSKGSRLIRIERIEVRKGTEKRIGT
jgi:hypothetical protein